MKLKLLFLSFIILTLASCSKQYYAPALLNNDIAYLPKPASFDSTKNALYVSGGFGVGQGADINDDVFFGTVEISAGHTFKNANLAYGAFGFAGNITDNSNGSSTSVGTQTFYGAGGRLSGNLYKKIGSVDLRYLGFEAVYSKEFGNYADFRKQAAGLTNFYSYTNTELLTAGLTSEVLWHSPNHLYKQYAFRLFLGRTLIPLNPNVNIYTDSKNYSIQTIYGALSYYMQIKHIFGVVEYSATPSELYWIPAFRLRLGYRF